MNGIPGGVLPVALGALAALVVLLWSVPRPAPWRPDLPGSGRRSRRGAGGWEEDGRPGVAVVGQGPSLASSTARGVTIVPEALELLALALQGGGSLAGSARSVAEVLPAVSGAGLAAVANALRGSGSADEAWELAGPAWEPARRSLELAAVAGVAPGDALRRAADDLRQGAVARVEVATARLGVRMVLPLGLAFLPAFVLTTVLPLVLALTRDLSW